MTTYCLADCGYLNVDCYKTLQPTAWIPLLDANEKNGCMQVCSIFSQHSWFQFSNPFGYVWYPNTQQCEVWFGTFICTSGGQYLKCDQDNNTWYYVLLRDHNIGLFDKPCDLLLLSFLFFVGKACVSLALPHLLISIWYIFNSYRWGQSSRFCFVFLRNSAW